MPVFLESPAARANPIAAQTRGIRARQGACRFDPNRADRVEQEATMLADRCDVTEEIVRLEGHLEQAHGLLARPDGKPLGKRLDFLLQEIFRETNTINSKSSDLELTRDCLELKSEADKVREQVQNIE